MKREKIQLSSLIERIIQSHKADAKEKQVQLEMVLDNTITEIIADENQLVETLHDFILNAIRFSVPNGNISIGTRCVLNGVEISVSDSGTRFIIFLHL